MPPSGPPPFKPHSPQPDDVQGVLHITTTASDLARLYPWLDAVGTHHRLPSPLLHAMQIALEEVVMNVAMHAFTPGDKGEITARLMMQPDAAVLVVANSGPPFDATSAPERPRPKSLAEAQPGGVGLKLLRHYCKDISYARKNELNSANPSFSLS